MINLVAGTVLLAYYLWKGIDEKDQRPYAAAFFIVGLVGLVTGLAARIHMASARQFQRWLR